MTTRLYYTDSYLTAFDARVVERADDGRRVYLERTAFYPTSGGQPHDLGTLGGAAVVDVVDEGERVAHLLDRPLDAAEGDVLAGRVDWARRFDHMQQHSGQHLLSAVFQDLVGWPTVSVHFGADESTLDLGVESVSRDALEAAEERANALVWQNRALAVTFEDAAAAAAEGLRKPSARGGELRIVSIDGVDRSACGGTHVRATGEIGPLLVRRTERIRRATRVEFLCGMRAVLRARMDREALARAAQAVGGAPDEVAALVEAQSAQLRELQSVRRRLEGDLAGYRARALYDAAEPDASGVRRVVERRETGAVEDLRPLALAVAELPKAVFVGVVAAPPLVMAAAAPDSGVDAGRVLKDAVAAAGGRGGGSPRIAQGSVPDVAALAAVLGRFGVAP